MVGFRMGSAALTKHKEPPKETTQPVEKMPLPVIQPFGDYRPDILSKPQGDYEYIPIPPYVKPPEPEPLGAGLGGKYGYGSEEFGDNQRVDYITDVKKPGINGQYDPDNQWQWFNSDHSDLQVSYDYDGSHVTNKQKENNMQIKKYTQKDRHGNMFSYEFDVPSMQEIPNYVDNDPAAMNMQNPLSKTNMQGVDNSIFKPKGTDTVPAMLTPGENVVNAEASRLPGVQPMLDELNDVGRAIQKKQGGPIPSYNAEGTKVEGESAGKDTGMRTVTDKKVYETPDGYKVSEQRITVGDNTHGYGHVPSIYNGIQYTPQQVEQMLYQGQIPQPDMRFKTPTEADYYARLNSQNLMNFRDDASYLQEGGFVIDDAMLDAIRQVESGGNVNAVSKVGASGPYQIMKATALKPGYGVTPIGLDERFDPDKSRTFAKQYLQGIMRANPDFTREEVITAYHSGAGNVRKAKMGQEELGSRGQAYFGKVTDAMGDVPPVQMANLSNDELTNMFPNAQNYGSRIDSVPEVETTYNPFNPKFYEEGQLGDLEQLKRAVGYPLEIFGMGLVPESAPGKDPGTIFDFAKGDTNKYKEINDKYQTKLKENKISNAQEELDAFNKRIKDQLDNNIKPTENDLKIKNELENDLKEKQDDLKKFKDKNVKLEKEKIETQKKIDKSFGIKSKENKNIIDKIIQETNDADYGEGKLTLDDADEAWAKKNLTGEYEGDFSQYLINKGQEIGGVVLDKSMEYFKNAFSSMFDGEELARMALMYAGSRALGYNHGASLNYGMKNYIKRVDANLAAAKKFSLTDKAREDYTEESLKKYAKTGNRDDLIPKKAGVNIIGGGTGSRLWLQNYGEVEKVKIGKDKYAIRLDDGNLVALDDPRIAGKWFTYDDDQMDSVKLTSAFSDSLEKMQKAINANIKADSDTKMVSANLPMLAQESTKLLRNDLIKYGAKPKDIDLMRDSMFKAQDMYMKQLRRHLDNPKDFDVPNSIEAFYNQTKIKLKTSTPGRSDGISFNDVKETTNKNFSILDERILKEAQSDVGINDKNEIAKQYRANWRSLKKAWASATPEQRKIWNDGAKKQKGWDGFTWWCNALLILDPEGSANELLPK